MSNQKNVIDVTEATFEQDVIEQSKTIPVVVDFWAPWCGPCRMLGPVLERLATDPAYSFILAKVNVDNNPNIAMRYQVQGIPAVKAFQDGQVVSEFVGAQPEPRVRDFLGKLTPPKAKDGLSEAKSLLAIRQWENAEAAFRQILREQPEDQASMVNLARALLAQGKGCDAIGYLQDCSDGVELAQAERLWPLANFLCRATTDWSEYDEVTPLEAQYRRAGHLFAKGNLAAAMDGVLEVLRQDKQYRKGEAHRIMLAVFELLGEEDTLTEAYRRELANVLF